MRILIKEESPLKCMNRNTKYCHSSIGKARAFALQLGNMDRNQAARHTGTERRKLNEPS